MDRLFRGNSQSDPSLIALILDCQSLFWELGSCRFWSYMNLVKYEVDQIIFRNGAVVGRMEFLSYQYQI